MNFSKSRQKRGGVLVEAVLSSCFFLPIIVFVILGILQVAHAYVIGVNMTEASQLAARALSDEYLRDPSIINNFERQQLILNRIRIPGMVTSAEQFQIPDGGWVITSFPRSITVSCTYMPGLGEPPLPRFPNPDPLGFAKRVCIRSSATVPIFQSW